MSQLKDFFDEERKRVFEPDAFFTQRVMARLKDGFRENGVWDFGIWEAVTGSIRPVLAVALPPAVPAGRTEEDPCPGQTSQRTDLRG